MGWACLVNLGPDLLIRYYSIGIGNSIRHTLGRGRQPDESMGLAVTGVWSSTESYSGNCSLLWALHLPMRALLLIFETV